MNPRYAKFLVISDFLLLSTPVFAASDIMKPYLLAEKGYKRMVIHLQPLENEDNYKIELMIGKTLKVDCNRHWFIGHLSEEIAKGWGVYLLCSYLCHRAYVNNDGLPSWSERTRHICKGAVRSRLGSLQQQITGRRVCT